MEECLLLANLVLIPLSEIACGPIYLVLLLFIWTNVSHIFLLTF